MGRYLLVRLGSAIVTVFGASILAFVFLRVLPGDPVRLILGRLATPEAVRAQTEEMGLNDDMHIQYLRFIGDFVRGDWGFGYTVGQPVTTLISSRVPASLELGLYAFTFALVLAVSLALLVTYRRRRPLDAMVRAVSYIGLGTPPFWLALVLLLFFSQKLPWLPGPEGRLSVDVAPPPELTHLYTVDALVHGQFATFWDAFKHLILPAATLGFASFAFLVRLLRANLLDVSHEPFMVVARSKGLGRLSAFWRHALPNASLPLLTASGLVLAELLAGSVLTEKVFDWPGVGALVVDSALRQDFAVVQVFIFLTAISYVVVNFVVDILYGLIDPRTRVPSALDR